MARRVSEEKILKHIKELKAHRRASLKPDSTWKGQAQELYSAAQKLSGIGDYHITAAKFKAELPNIRPTDFCYNLTNFGDKEYKFLKRVGRGKFRFVDFEWSCEQGVPVTWRVDELEAEFTVGEYKDKEFRWNSNELEKFLQGHQASDIVDDIRDIDIVRQECDRELLDPANLEDARTRILTSIVRRQGQSQFRQKLLVAYRGECAVSDCNAEPALEAAHIIPYLGTATNVTSNGLLLRADIHTLFDMMQLTIDPEAMRVLVASKLEKTPYQGFHQQKLKLPGNERDMPSQEALKKHCLQFRKHDIK
jgi:hypothetical protein